MHVSGTLELCALSAFQPSQPCEAGLDMFFTKRPGLAVRLWDVCLILHWAETRFGMFRALFEDTGAMVFSIKLFSGYWTVLACTVWCVDSTCLT